MTDTKRKFTPGRKISSGGDRVYRKWSEYTEGDVVIGTYVSTHIDNYKKDCFVVTVEDAQFQDKTGKNFKGKDLVLNGAGSLKKQMAEVPMGSLFQLTYMGLEEMTGGPYEGKDRHIFEVLLDGSEAEEDASEEDYDL